MLARFITRLDDSNVLVGHPTNVYCESLLHRSQSLAGTGLGKLPVVYFPALDVDDICCGMTRKSGQYDPVV